jgi:hypothetical protein
VWPIPPETKPAEDETSEGSRPAFLVRGADGVQLLDGAEPAATGEASDDGRAHAPLIWEQHGVAVRIETTRGLTEALKVAESMR